MHKLAQIALVVSHYMHFVLITGAIGYYLIKKLKHKINSF